MLGSLSLAQRRVVAVWGAPAHRLGWSALRLPVQVPARSFYQYLDQATHRLGAAMKDAAVKTGLSSGSVAVGEDEAGNKYYEEPPIYSGGPPKRSIVTPGGLADAFDFDANAVPSEWRHWLSCARLDPPTPEELQGRAVELEALQGRVRALEAEEAKERHTMMLAKAVAEEREAKQVHAALEKSKHTTQTEKAEPSGQGESFQPGAWRPGG